VQELCARWAGLPAAEARFVRRRARPLEKIRVKHWPIVGLFLLQACAGLPKVWSPDSRINSASCVVPGAPASDPWQLVTAPGFTFCVPASWRPNGEHSWVAGADSIVWGVGQPPMRMVPGVVLGDAVTQPYILGRVAVCHERDYVGRVDRSRAGMQDFRCPDRHYTFAQFMDPPVHLEGQAQSARAAAVELAIYRTVRFIRSSGVTGVGGAPPPN